MPYSLGRILKLANCVFAPLSPVNIIPIQPKVFYGFSEFILMLVFTSFLPFEFEIFKA